MSRLLTAAFALCCCAGPTMAQDLMVLRWSEPSQLSALSQSGLIQHLRYIAPRIAVVEGNAAQRTKIEQLGLSLLVFDKAAPNESYYLSDHLHFPLPDGQEVIYIDYRGWSLSKVAARNFGRVHDEQIFLYPLPERFSAEGWIPTPLGKPTAPAAAPGVSELIAKVNPARLRTDVESLALVDPSKGSVANNIRTRFARRPETFESTSYIQQQLSDALGANSVRLQEFRIAKDDITMYNVIGELLGSDPEAGYYVICAHYDAIGTRSQGGWNWRTDVAPGADDNASGVALVLESARVLAERKFPWSIRFIAWSGEELGLWGSRHYAREALANDDRILGVLNFDMIGFNHLKDRLELVANPESVWLVNLLRSTNERFDVGLRIDVLEDPFAGLSDHAPFWARGYDAVLGIENYLPTDSTTTGVREGLYRLNSQYHSVVDLPDSINWELVSQVTRLTVAALAQFGTENGLPNLMVFGGDLKGDPENDLRIRVSNMGSGALEEVYRVRVSRCAADSSKCQVVYDRERSGPLAAGAIDDITVPWKRFGESVFLVEADPEDEINEADENDNRAFQKVRLVPADDIVVYPNPFSPNRDPFLTFSGLPFFARVQIMDLNGELLWTDREENQNDLSNEIRWLGVNSSGFSLSGGVYIYSIRDLSGQLLKRDKIAVIR